MYLPAIFSLEKALGIAVGQTAMNYIVENTCLKQLSVRETSLLANRIVNQAIVCDSVSFF